MDTPSEAVNRSPEKAFWVVFNKGGKACTIVALWEGAAGPTVELTGSAQLGLEYSSEHMKAPA